MKPCMLLSILALLSATALAAGCGNGSGNNGSTAFNEPGCNQTMPAAFPLSTVGVQVGDTIPDVTLHDIKGAPVCTRGDAGRVLLVDEGAGWCVYCRQEAAFIESLYTKYHADGFDVVMGMYQNYNNGPANQSFLDQWNSVYGITFLTLPDSQATIFNTYVDTVTPDPNYTPGYLTIPLNVIVDRDQRIAYNQIGGFQDQIGIDHLVSALVSSSAHLTYDSTP